MKVLLVDDHPLMRMALRTVVKSFGSDAVIVDADSPAQVREIMSRHESFDVVVLEVRLGSGDGLGLLRELRQSRPKLPVVIFTASDEGRDLIRAVDGGAMAYVHKRSGQEAILKALDTVVGGGIYLPPDTMTLLKAARLEAVQQASGQADQFGAGAIIGNFSVQTPSPQAIARLGLTPRQTDVLMLLLHGKPNKLIARELNLSVETIKDHVAAVLRSLNVSSRTQAVLAVTQLSHGAPNSTLRRGLHQ